MQEPALPEGITGAGLDEDVQAELRSLVKETADSVAAHLVAAATLLDEDPEAAYLHAVYARARASRVGSVREAVGIAAYMTGRYTEALSELRAVKRIHGTDIHLPVMADCQRGLGRPERALEMAGSPEAARLDIAGQVELRIVAAGARQDMGQLDAAVLTLQCAQLRDAKAPWAARLRYAYAEALITAGREDEGRTWMAKAVDADQDGQTDAADRLAELDGVSFVELDDSEFAFDGDAVADSLAESAVESSDEAAGGPVVADAAANALETEISPVAEPAVVPEQAPTSATVGVTGSASPAGESGRVESVQVEKVEKVEKVVQAAAPQADVTRARTTPGVPEVAFTDAVESSSPSSPAPIVADPFAAVHEQTQASAESDGGGSDRDTDDGSSPSTLF